MFKLRCKIKLIGDTRYYYYDGMVHRLNGPAVISYNGPRAWYRYNLLHREDGPAVEYSNGHKEWWLNGIRLSEEEFNKQIRQAHNV